MRKLVSLTLFFLLLSLAAVAEDTPKAEVFGGYQYTRLGGGSGVNLNGWNGALTGNFNKWFGVTADFSGSYKSVSGVSLSAYSYTFGPVVALRRGKVTPFAHALFGGFHLSPGSTDGFAMAVGGGVDFKVAPKIAVRAIQVDWLSLRAQGTTENNNARISAGIVLHL